MQFNLQNTLLVTVNKNIFEGEGGDSYKIILISILFIYYLFVYYYYFVGTGV
jgi:hypothetical protein